jgi:hypothetical protein
LTGKIVGHPLCVGDVLFRALRLRALQAPVDFVQPLRRPLRRRLITGRPAAGVVGRLLQLTRSLVQLGPVLLTREAFELPRLPFELLGELTLLRAAAGCLPLKRTQTLPLRLLL